MIFLAADKSRLYNSYTESQLAAAPVLDMTDVMESPEMYTGTKVIFSTWGMPSLTTEEIEKYFPNLKAVFYAAGSVQHFARPFLEMGVRIFSAWAGNAVPVAEFSAAQIVLANKGYFQMPDLYRTKGGIAAREYSETFPGNYGVKVGLLGAGKIGRHVISLLRPYNIELLVFDPFLSLEEAQELGVEKESLEVIFTKCQTISNHLANNKHTVGILNYNLFSRMADNATFINTGRGMQVVEEDLLRALRECPRRTALLDVSIVEHTPPGTPLLNAPNLYMTPHRAGSFNNEIKRMGLMMFEAHSQYLAGEVSDCEVTIPMLETMA